MANDTLWMRCCYCGAGLKITKYYPSTELGHLATTPETIATWLTDHLNERQEAEWRLGGNLEATPGIECVTEDPETSTGQMYVGPARHPYWDRPFPPTPAEIAWAEGNPGDPWIHPVPDGDDPYWKSHT